jgi:hypothetical protein
MEFHKDKLSISNRCWKICKHKIATMLDREFALRNNFYLARHSNRILLLDSGQNTANPFSCYVSCIERFQNTGKAPEAAPHLIGSWYQDGRVCLRNLPPEVDLAASPDTSRGLLK